MKRSEALELLDDYVSGQLPDHEASSFEEDLFEAAAVGQAADPLFLDRVAMLGRYLQGRVGLTPGSTRAQVDALLASDLEVHYMDLGSGGRCALAAWPEDTEIVVTRLGVDLRGYTNVEVECATLDGKYIKTFRDVQYDPDEGALYAVCEEPLARMGSLVGPTIARISALRDGRRELVAEYETHLTTPE